LKQSVIRKICVYCASSRQANSVYSDSAYNLGSLLAKNHITIVYGGGSVGSMGALANGALSSGGKVIGILPQFMHDLEWGHKGLTQLHIVEGMQERKRLMIEGVDATVALPGGSGTFEELLETITQKRLGLYLKPIILVNTCNYYDPLIAMLKSAVQKKFMDHRHLQVWQVVEQVEEVLEAIRKTPAWSSNAVKFAAP
jgi:uncharacterized protein (TIGR00730 family)